ncbi:IS4-like element ISBthe3 family transposase [Nibrella saemangeumensis]|uniref:IS4-like element ISBthe3 family transposase n=1 Tax=Nibrella saemangeumensis TaxID=1084526 RepID=A0ABP8N6X4_9BACT
MQTRHLTGLKDKRLTQRGNLLLNRLFAIGGQSIRQLATSDSQAKAFYRFLANENVTEQDLIRNMAANCQACVADRPLLCIQDSSEINLANHRNRLKKNDSIGLTDGSQLGLGFFIHPSLVIDAQTFMPYGFAALKVWNRGQQWVAKASSYQRHTTPIEQKESYKWIETSLHTKQALTTAQHLVIIQDREGDIYEQFCLVPDARTHLLIRAKTNRTLRGKTKLFEHLASQAQQGSYTIEVAGDKRRKTTRRTATLAVRFCRVSLKRNQFTAKTVADTVSLYAIEAQEVAPQVDQPIHWRLLTTWPVNTLADALQCLDWYSCRWLLEEVFRIVKKEGFDIEASELTQGKAVRKLCLLILETIIKLFIMQAAYDSEQELPAGSCFSAEEQACMEIQMPQLEGKTQKLKNPYTPSTLKRYIWVIARLGGWNGYQSGRKPGITTFWLGLKKFDAIVIGFTLSKDVSRR